LSEYAIEKKSLFPFKASAVQFAKSLISPCPNVAPLHKCFLALDQGLTSTYKIPKSTQLASGGVGPAEADNKGETTWSLKLHQSFVPSGPTGEADLNERSECYGTGLEVYGKYRFRLLGLYNLLRQTTKPDDGKKVGPDAQT
jgi:hypothetical protein